MEQTVDEPCEGVFRTFPQNKKVRSRVRTRVRECPLVPAHPRRLLSSVFVSSSGSRSWMSMDSSSGTWTQEKRAGKWRRASILAGGCAMACISTLATWLSDGLSSCLLVVESAWSSVLSRSRVAHRPLVRMAVTVVWWLDVCFGAWFDSGYMLCDTWVLMSCCQSTKAWVLFPFTAQCLVLCGTCCASVTWCFWSDSAENCGYSAVAVHRRSSISCRSAEADSHGLAFGRP